LREIVKHNVKSYVCPFFQIGSKEFEGTNINVFIHIMEDKINTEIQEYFQINQNIGLHFNLNITETTILCYIGYLYQEHKSNILIINSDFIINKLPLLNINCKDTINKILTNLSKITKNFDRGLSDKCAVEFIKNNFFREKTNILFSHKYCDWCNCESLSFSNHHFPIRKKDGGAKTVNICQNCHQLFHDITDNKKSIYITNEQFFNNIFTFTI